MAIFHYDTGRIIGTMYQQYNQQQRDDDLPPPPPSSSSYAYSAMSSRPTTATSQYSYAGNYLQDIVPPPPIGGPNYMREPNEDDRASFESRSLAGYSQMSSTGRGREASVLGDFRIGGGGGAGYG